MKYTDEQLSAFLDGELSESEMSAIEKALTDDPSLASRLESLATVDAQLQNTFAPVLDAPLPASVMAMLDAPSDAPVSNVTNFSDYKDKRKNWPLFTAIAASLVAGFFSAQILNITDNTPIHTIAAGPVSPNSALYNVLSSLPSGQSQDDVTILLSFKSTNGNYCREFTTSQSRGLACENQKDWVVISQSYTPTNNTNNDYATASAESSIAFDTLIDSLMNGDILEIEQEKKLIQSGWNDK